ncbi:ABC transporter ATPase [Microbacterium sp. HM58-2]|nr:ABC transporter ATPase [Microbacterium sp. HM58-2]
MSSPIARRRLSPSLIAGLILAAILLLIAVLAPLLLDEAATRMTDARRLAPNADHWFGTDDLGRDILSRALVATRLTLVMSAAATAIAVVLGVLVGGVVWLLPARLRELILRVIDATVAFPSLVLGLIIAAVLGPGAISATVAIGIAGIPSFARIAANLTGGIVHREYVVTARLLGVGEFAIFTRHLLPNIAGALLMLSTSSFALSLLEISSLSFVGLGVQTPQFDFGRVLNESLTTIYVQPLGSVAPAAMLILAGVTAMLIGDGLASTLDPRQKIARIQPVIDTPPGRRDPEAVLEVSRLVVRAPNGDPLVRGVTFSVKTGEIVGLVGESGSGKSMTAMAIAGLLADGVTAEAEALRLGDLDLSARVSPKRLATEIGLVYQDPGTTFNPALRMGNQLTEVLRVHLGLSRGAARSRLVQALTEVRIREAVRRIGQHPHEWSGGMLQRASIASAMMSNPKLLIADEATTALDVTVQADVLRQFKTINRDHGTAMLFISHDIGVVQELCDRVIVMRGGEHVEELTGAQLKAGDACHPYTQRLLASAPSFNPRAVSAQEGEENE